MAFLTSVWKPEDISRICRTNPPILRAASGRRSGPRTIKASSRTTKSSPLPMFDTPASLPLVQRLHGGAGPGRLGPEGVDGGADLGHAVQVIADLVHGPVHGAEVHDGRHRPGQQHGWGDDPESLQHHTASGFAV